MGSVSVVGLAGWVIFSGVLEPPLQPSDRRDRALRRGIQLLERSWANWRQNQSCFGCHHQTLPQLALYETARLGILIPSSYQRDQAEHAHRFFRKRAAGLNRGENLPGGSLTASYGLWTLRLGGYTSDETTAALTGYLLRSRHNDGSWTTSCNRPPLQSSTIAAVVLARSTLRTFAPIDQEEARRHADERAACYLRSATLTTNEDRVWRLLGLIEFPEADAVRDAVIASLLATQRPDGGWSQEIGMGSDAYATGQALYALRKAGLSADAAPLRAAMDYLLRTQYPDGSWRVVTRAFPVQRYFDNGDPFGKHQFLSIAGTGWALAGLAQMHAP